MFDNFGEFDSWEELNRTAEGLKKEGDLDNLKVLAAENGIDEMDMVDYVNGDMPTLCTAVTAALGKLTVEKAEMTIHEIVEDWISYIESELTENEQLALLVRRKGKSLIGCIGAILNWSYAQRYKVDDRIIKASGISASGVEMGIPGMATAKKLIWGYYTK